MCHEGWLYLAVVLDLFSRQVAGWSMQSRMETDLALDALLMIVWRRLGYANGLAPVEFEKQYFNRLENVY